MLIYRVMENDGCYNECEPYRMGGITSLPSNGNYVKGLNSFDYSKDKYHRHFFVFSEDAVKYLKTRRNPKNYCIGEFNLEDNLAIQFSGIGTRYETINIPSLEIALPTSLLERKKLREIFPNLNITKNNDFIEDDNWFENNDYLLDCYFKITGLDITGRLYNFDDENIKETYRDIYELYQNKLWKEFIEAYNLIYKNDSITRCYEQEDSSIYTKRAKILSKYNLITNTKIQ